MLPNKKSVPIIRVTRQELTNQPEIFRMFRLLYERLKAKKVMFDPLNVFKDQDQEDS